MRTKKIMVFGLVSACILNVRAWATNSTLQALDKAKSPDEWNAAIGQTAQLTPAVDSELREYVNDKSKDGRKRAIAFRTLCAHNSRNNCDQMIIDRLHDSDDINFRAGMIMELAHSTSQQTISILRHYLTDNQEDAHVQIAAADALALRGDASGKDRAVQSIVRGEYIADQAMVTLEVLKATDVLPTLESCYRTDTHYLIKNSCRLAVLRLQIEDRPAIEQAQLLKAALEEDGFFEVRRWAGLKLGKMGSEPAREALVEVWNNKSAPGRENAINGLDYGVQKGHWTEEQAKRGMDLVR